MTNGDGSTVEYLRAAGCDKCQALVAVTGRDEVNLITCQIAKKAFAVENGSPGQQSQNAVVLRSWVDIAVSSTDNLARILEREVETAAIQQVLSLAGGTATLIEIQVPEEFKYHGKSLANIPISQDAVIISITRSGELLIPAATPRCALAIRFSALRGIPRCTNLRQIGAWPNTDSEALWVF